MKSAIRREAPASEKTGDRTRRFVLSDESVDRYNTTFSADGWELANFEKNPVVLWVHNSYALPLGKAAVRVENKQLLADVEFFDESVNPDAPRVMKMVDAGVLGVSVGARIIEAEYNEERESEDEVENWWNPPIDYKRQELLEMSVVTVPGNPNALPLRDASLDEMRLVTQAVVHRSAAAENRPNRAEVQKLREAARARRASAEIAAAIGAQPAPPPAPAPVDPELETLEVEGLDDAAVSQLIADTVKEAITDRQNAERLRERGELEVA